MSEVGVSTGRVAQEAPSVFLREFCRYASLVTTLLVVLRCAYIFATPLRSPGIPLRFAQDDFFYYLKPAQNLAWLHRSTFDGTTLTNGYHPLYFALITLLCVPIHTVRGVFGALWAIDLLSATTIFLCALQLLRKIAGVLLANALAVAITILCVPLICDQMEVTLALPFGFAFLAVGFVTADRLTRARVSWLGLLGALTCLSRLDAGLLVAMYALALLCDKTFRRALCWSKVALFAAALLLPIGAYLMLNYHFFGTLLPISGMAKQLRHSHRLSFLLPGSFNGTSELLLVAAVATAALAWSLRRYLQPKEKVFLFTVLSTPFLFYGLEMVVSDWPIWNWYFYDLRFAAAGAALLFAVCVQRIVPDFRRGGIAAQLRSDVVAGVLLLGACLVLCLQHYKVDHWMVEIEHAAGVLDRFAEEHPGRYAMGDRAGMFAITTKQPVLQTEGLVMDKAYLRHIQRQDDLRAVLSQYGVNYYVAFVFDRNLSWQVRSPCFHAMEPSIAGPDALRMRSDFCDPPVFAFPGMDGEYFIYRVNPS